MKFILAPLLFLITFAVRAQNGTVKIAISRDTVLLGNAFYLIYTFELKEALFKAPDIQDGTILGQSMMNNTSFVDGQMKAISSQRYLIQPAHAGRFTIPATTIKSSSGDVEVPSIEVYVKENPSNLEEDPEEDNEWKNKDILINKNVNPSRKTKKI
ncbi:MAG: BatD family protein [Saprospiraceae bacterium]|nr:BatD family protein [Saprospiraceae bacterium]